MITVSKPIIIILNLKWGQWWALEYLQVRSRDANLQTPVASSAGWLSPMHMQWLSSSVLDNDSLWKI